MTDDTSRVLFCLIEGDSRPFKVTPNKGDILDLKDLIRKNGVLRNVLAKDLVLWKLHKPEPLKPNHTIAERIQSRGTEISQFAQQLDIQDNLFPEQVPEKHLHILVQLPPADNNTIESISNECLSLYRNDVKVYLRQMPHYRTWQSQSKDQRVVQHVSKLAIPEMNGGPSLLLHRTGAKIDPELISDVFNKYARDIRLINTSGSGKTRVLIEGLRENWGFYLTFSSLDGTGSNDMGLLMELYTALGFTQTLPSSTTQHSPKLDRNRQMVCDLSWQVLIARLLVFRMFLEEARKLRPEGSLDNYRDHWVYFQLQPSEVTGNDIFGHMTKILSDAGNENLDDACLDLAWNIRSKYLSMEDFYIVLDAAQLAAGSCTGASRSYVDPKQSPPLLEIIMDSFDWLRIGHTIVSGTGLSLNIVSQAMGSCVAKQGVKTLTVTEIGAFDSELAQRTYILQYLPSFYVDTPSGEALLDRAWHWLRGRHHFTASFIQILLNDSLRSPHKLLNEYIYHLTGITPSDSPPFADDEPNINVKLSDYTPLMSFDKITGDSDCAGRLGEIICSWILHQRVIALRDEERDWVEFGFARFTNNNGDSRKQQVIIDEPLFIFAAANHLANKMVHGLVDQVLESMGKHEGKGEHFKDWLVVYFSLAFGPGVALCQVFNFGDNVPDWARIEGVELVVMSSNGEGYKTNDSLNDNAGIPITLCRDSQSATETVKWFENPDTVMCLPDIHLGPDIVFFVLIPGRGVICIIVQLKYQSLPHLDKWMQEDAHSTLEPSNFYREKNLTSVTAEKWSDYRTRIMARVHQLGTIDDARWFPDKGAPFLRVCASWPAEDHGCKPPIVSLNMAHVHAIMDNGSLLVDLLNKEYAQSAKRKHIEAEVMAGKDVETVMRAGKWRH